MRAEHGCGPLRMHAGLARSAGRQARLLLADGELDHDAGSPMAQRLHRAAPGLDAGRGSRLGHGRAAHSRRSIVQAWMGSPPHRRILLDCRFSRLGVGIATGRFGETASATVYVADFAA